MKYCIFFLKFSIGAFLISFAVYFYLFCLSDDGGLEPVEIETMILAGFTIIGILSSLLLIRKAPKMGTIWFSLAFVAYVLLFAFPAIISALYTLALLTMG